MNTDTILDEVAINQFIWKSPRLLAACLTIAQKALESPVFWPDSVVFSFLVYDDDRNLIGSAWRQCANTLGIVEKTGQYRRSKGERTNGRIVFEYRIVDALVARAFLKRHGLAKIVASLEPQMALL